MIDSVAKETTLVNVDADLSDLSDLSHNALILILFIKTGELIFV